jgi:type IX secretion system PorP/SprF family membrane protein
MKKVLTAVATLLTTFSLAQQDPQFSQNMFNRLYPNPGYAGTNDAICGSLLYRDQWDKFGGGPKTAVFSIDAPVEFLHGGLGLSVLSDKPLNQKNLDIKLAYSYHLNLGAGKLGIGLDGGLLQRGYGNDFNAIDPDDPLVKSGTGSKFDLGAGLYYNSDKFYLGASATHLTGGKIEYASDAKVEVSSHYYFMGGINFDLTPSLKLKPSFFVKTDTKETQADINANLHIKDKIWIGASYRLEDAVVVMAGINLFENLRLGYSYDITTSKLSGYQNGTHEIFLGYCYKIKPRVVPVLKNVRFL